MDHDHNVPGSRLPEENPGRLAAVKEHMRYAPYPLGPARREIVLSAITEVCHYRYWMLLAVHVRTEHVHVVVQADRTPEQVMATFKCYASRALNRSEPALAEPRRWARHGSTRYLWTRDEISAAVAYVASGQGREMACVAASAR